MELSSFKTEKKDCIFLIPFEFSVKRLRTSPPTTDALSAVHTGYGYLQQDARATWGYDCLRQTVDPRYNIYPGMHFSGAHSKGLIKIFVFISI